MTATKNNQVQIINSTLDTQKKNVILEISCRVSGIDKDRLLTGKDEIARNLRQQCFYLLQKNTNLSLKNIASIFGMSRNVIKYGIETIEVHSKLYVDTLRSLRTIVKTANEKTCNMFELKF